MREEEGVAARRAREKFSDFIKHILMPLTHFFCVFQMKGGPLVMTESPHFPFRRDVMAHSSASASYLQEGLEK